jgi:protein-L-isoaspartate(D-aspartate) O-methyltransferase
MGDGGNSLMNCDSELAIVRRAYAKRIAFAAGINDARVQAAFAAVPREAFLDPGPWSIVVSRQRPRHTYLRTPDADPVFVYTDDVIAILPERNLNNGQPSLHAALIASAAPQAGEHIVHIGIGFGYYTAILAELVGPLGQVTAIELDPDLAARSTKNLATYPNVRIIAGNGVEAAFDPADVIYVNAGATRPADNWLDRLAEGGRLILPLTDNGFPNGDVRRGAVFRIERQSGDFFARRISGVAIFPCAGAREPASEAALRAAFAADGVERVARLYRRDDLPAEQCWLRAPGWCLAYE